MPYITKKSREFFNFTFLNDLPPIDTAGELNYLMTQLARKYIRDHGLRYEHINAVMGVFAAAGTEFYRRVAAPYEDTKVAENGDVYTVDQTGRCE